MSVTGEAAEEGEEPTLSHRLIRVTTWGGSNARLFASKVASVRIAGVFAGSEMQHLLRRY